jgi:hypothetical protein
VPGGAWREDRREWPNWLPRHQTQRDIDQQQEEDKRNSPEASERREGHRRRISGGAAELRCGLLGAAALRTREREGEWCGVKRRPDTPFIGRRRERKGWPRRWRELDRLAINGGGPRWRRV